MMTQIRCTFMVYSFKNVVIVTECINDRSDTNKLKICLDLTCALNVYLNDKYQRHFIDKLI